ncbi:hypothetical protein KBX34_10065 [Micromonospora sp. M61]|nr:hypothetical protein [Micromonospora sp. M61]MBQ1035191.1 hypothetical protein [Micromonospora sp. C81]
MAQGRRQRKLGTVLALRDHRRVHPQRAEDLVGAVHAVGLLDLHVHAERTVGRDQGDLAERRLRAPASRPVRDDPTEGADGDRPVGGIRAATVIGQRRLGRTQGAAHPDKLVTALVLRDLCQLDYQEIAGQLGIPVGTLKSRIHHARRHVRESLEGG